MVHNFIYIMNKVVKNKIVYSNFQPLTNSYMGSHVFTLPGKTKVPHSYFSALTCMSLSKFPRQHVAIKSPPKPTGYRLWRLYIPSHNSQFVPYIHKHLAKSSFQRIQNLFLVPTPLILTQKTKMNFRNTSTLLIIFVICVAILSRGGVEATRVLSEDFGNANSLETGSPIYVKAKDIMAYWLQRLPSGPSPGEGH